MSPMEYREWHTAAMLCDGNIARPCDDCQHPYAVEMLAEGRCLVLQDERWVIGDLGRRIVRAKVTRTTAGGMLVRSAWGRRKSGNATSITPPVKCSDKL